MKKHITNLRVLAVLLLAATSLSSCLKDPRFINFASSPPLVEFPLQAFQANKVIVIGAATNSIPIVASAGTYNLPVTVNLASANVLTVPVTFTVTIDNSVLTAPAAVTTKTSTVTPTSAGQLLTTYYPLPAADYTATGLTGTIPAGQRTATFNIALNGPAIGNTVKNYCLHFVITQASQQISNYNFINYLVQLQ